MDNSVGNSVVNGNEYLETLKESWPLIFICFIASFFYGLQKVKSSYTNRGFLNILINQIFTSCSAMLIGFCAVLLLPLFIDNPSPHFEMGVGIICSILGQNTINILLMRYFGLHTLDLKDNNDVDTLRERMAEQDKELYANQCYYKPDLKKVKNNESEKNNDS